MNKINIGIIGGAGYTGGELIRILINHPLAHIAFINSTSQAGKKIDTLHADLVGETDLVFTGGDPDYQQIQVLFLCVGHGEAKKFIEKASIPHSVRVIDLSQDYRIRQQAQSPLIGGEAVVYGLPELNRDAIRKAKHIANPGCFATAIQLGLLPLAKAGLLADVYTTGITGSTGAGQSLSNTSHFSWRANNIQAYKTLTHQHMNEVMQSLAQLQPGYGSDTPAHAPVHFVPWRGDFTRGIFVSSQLHCHLPESDLIERYEEFYYGHPFTVISREPLALKQVVNTNKCIIHIEQVGDQLVVHSAIDNLLKGASGQAVQNMNLMFGAEETTGLKLKANYF